MCLCHEDGDWRSYSCDDGEYDTNQQLVFELDEFGQQRFVGSNEEGMVKIYDVTRGRLESTLNNLMNQFTHNDVDACFSHCGYN